MKTFVFNEGKTRIKHRNHLHHIEKNFFQLFQDQVKKNPNRVVVVADDNSLTYDELNRKSDGLAQYLRKSGIDTGDRIGLCSFLNTDFLVCMLGILKAGAVYLPLDHAYPLGRLQFMLKEGAPTAILVDPQLTRFFKNKKLACDNIIKINKEIFEKDDEDSIKHLRISSESLAYIIYTSGSTGTPKGIMVTHKSLPNIALAHNDYYPANIRMLVAGGVCFDATLLVIFHALANNEPLFLMNYRTETDIKKLVEFIENNFISFMICVPSQYLKILNENRKLNSLKCVSLTGENLPVYLCQLHAQLAPNAILYNEYGPTECAIGTTIAKIYDPKLQTIQPISVGKPLPNTQVHILDQELNKLPKGSKGEICVSGIGLARGYLNNEKLTAEQFCWAALQGKKRVRFYRTGDMGRFLSNGELEFLGRIERNIQIGKTLINLGEIECRLSLYPEIEACAVQVQATEKGEKRLLIYFTAKKKFIKSSLLKYLQDFFFEGMVSIRLIQLEKFPLSPNGKINRDVLEGYDEW